MAPRELLHLLSKVVRWISDMHTLEIHPTPPCVAGAKKHTDESVLRRHIQNMLATENARRRRRIDRFLERLVGRGGRWLPVALPMARGPRCPILKAIR